MSARRSRPDDDQDPPAPREDEEEGPAAPDLRPVEGPAADQQLALLSRAISHPARVQILRLLVRRGRCLAGEIVAELPLAQSTVSQHLKIMKEVGLIRGEERGARVYYCPEMRTVRRLKALVASL